MVSMISTKNNKCFRMIGAWCTIGWVQQINSKKGRKPKVRFWEMVHGKEKKCDVLCIQERDRNKHLFLKDYVTRSRKKTTRQSQSKGIYQNSVWKDSSQIMSGRVDVIWIK